MLYLKKKTLFGCILIKPLVQNSTFRVKGTRTSPVIHPAWFCVMTLVKSKAILWLVGPSHFGYATVKPFMQYVFLGLKLVAEVSSPNSLCNGPLENYIT